MTKYRVIALIVGSSLAVAGSALAGPACDQAGKRAGGGPGARFAQMDADADGKVSLAELTASRESWLKRADADGNGVATAAELEASAATNRQQRLQRMFERQDADGDGRLSTDESRMPSEWFQRADKNQDGGVTLAELSEAREAARQGKRGGAGKRRVGRLDANGDGNISLDEVRSAAAGQFARLDRDGDGALSRDELRSRHGRGHGKHRQRGGDKGQSGSPDAAAPART